MAPKDPLHRKSNIWHSEMPALSRVNVQELNMQDQLVEVDQEDEVRELSVEEEQAVLGAVFSERLAN